MLMYGRLGTARFSMYHPQTALRYKIEMEYEAKTRDRCGHCADKLEAGQYGRRGIKAYCKACIEEPTKLIAIFSQPGEVRAGSRLQGRRRQAAAPRRCGALTFAFLVARTPSSRGGHARRRTQLRSRPDAPSPSSSSGRANRHGQATVLSQEEDSPATRRRPDIATGSLARAARQTRGCSVLVSLACVCGPLSSAPPVDRGAAGVRGPRLLFVCAVLIVAIFVVACLRCLQRVSASGIELGHGRSRAFVHCQA